VDSPSPPEALKVSPSPPDRVETPSPVSGARLDPVAGTPVVTGASVPPAATPVPADSLRAAGLRLPAPPPPAFELTKTKILLKVKNKN
jgi:hypothetical protein